MVCFDCGMRAAMQQWGSEANARTYERSLGRVYKRVAQCTGFHAQRKRRRVMMSAMACAGVEPGNGDGGTASEDVAARARRSRARASSDLGYKVSVQAGAYGLGAEAEAEGGQVEVVSCSYENGLNSAGG